MKRKYSWPLMVSFILVALILALVDGDRLWGQKVDDPVLLTAGGDSYIYRLQLNNGATADYTECVGLGSSNDVEEAVRVTSEGVVYTEKTPGPLEWHNITLRRDGPSDLMVWQWRRAMEDMNLNEAMQRGSILMLAAGSSEPVAQWGFVNAWAARLTMDGSQEELVIVLDELQRIGTGGGAPSRR